MSTHRRFIQDRRILSRVSALLDCKIIQQEVAHGAVIVDLSPHGAYLSSKFLPAEGSTVTLSLQTPQLKKPVALSGRVVRGKLGTSDYGKINNFGIRFHRVSLELIGMLKELAANGGGRIPKRQGSGNSPSNPFSASLR